MANHDWQGHDWQGSAVDGSDLSGRARARYNSDNSGHVTVKDAQVGLHQALDELGQALVVEMRTAQTQAGLCPHLPVREVELEVAEHKTEIGPRNELSHGTAAVSRAALVCDGVDDDLARLVTYVRERHPVARVGMEVAAKDMGAFQDLVTPALPVKISAKGAEQRGGISRRRLPAQQGQPWPRRPGPRRRARA